MKRIINAGIVFASAATLIACSDSNPSAPPAARETQPPPGVMISNSLKSTSASVGTLGGAQALPAVGGSAYVSAAPGTFPGGTNGRVQNQTTGGLSHEFEFSDGGFDPVAIPASVGDELSLTLFLNGSASNVVIKVPPRRPPEVVRTQPAKGRTDVALNIHVQVVFSEPVDKLTVTPSSVTLYEDGHAVSATVTTSGDGLTAVLIPEFPLHPLSTYNLVLTSAIRDLDGDAAAELTPVTFTTEALAEPAPGGELLFVRLSDRQLYRIGLDGKNAVRLTSSGANDHAAWSPKGDLIAFGRGALGPENNGFGLSDIYVMSEVGSNVTSRSSGLYLRSAAWSPDGKTLAVSDEGVYYGDISTISAVDDGHAPIHIASDARTPAWSPDGRRIAFVRLSGDDGYHQIFQMNPDGSNVTPLTEFDSGGIYGLSWSPDGRQLAFGKCIEPTGCQIYLINADGSQLHRITDEGNAQNPTWSPDGKWIAFMSSFWSGPNFDWHPSLAYVSVDGGAVRKVIDDAFYPSWRP